jgi:hypothetical protein
MSDILPPSSDIVFKMLFGSPRNSDILTSFLQAALSLWKSTRWNCQNCQTKRMVLQYGHGWNF